MKVFGGKKLEGRKVMDYIGIAFYVAYFICVLMFIATVLRMQYKIGQLEEQTNEVTELLEDRVEALNEIIEQEKESTRIMGETYKEIVGESVEETIEESAKTNDRS